MIFAVTSVGQSQSLYSKQKTYGERLKAYKTSIEVNQVQRDVVSISPRAVESLDTHRRIKEEKQVSMSYTNPRVSNPA